MENQLLGPFARIKEKIIHMLRKDGVSDVIPTEAERIRFAKSPAYLVCVINAIRVLCKDYRAAFAIEDSPTPVKALFEMLVSNEQMFRDRLPPNYRNKPIEEIANLQTCVGDTRCLLATISELETSMHRKYNEVVAEEKVKKKMQIKKLRERLKRKRLLGSINPPNDGPNKLDKVDLVTDKLDKVIQQGSIDPPNDCPDKLDKVDLVTDKLDKVIQQASIDPPNDGPDKLDKVDLVTDKLDKVIQQASIDPPNDGPDKLDKVDLVTGKLDKVDLVTDKLDKTCIPKQDLTRYSPGRSTNINISIFKGELIIPGPLSNTDGESIPIMYFKLGKIFYRMSGFYWADFSLKYPSEHVLKVYGVGETLDEHYFIACEIVEQTLATWLKDHIRHDNPLPSTLKKFIRDVIIGGTYVHNQSNGSLRAEVSIHNVYIVNGRAKLSLMSPRTPTLDSAASFRNMVKREIFKDKTIPMELDILLQSVHTNRWHLSPLFFTASQLCTYAVLACERIRASSYIQRRLREITDFHQTRLGIGDQNWIPRVKHKALLRVLFFKLKIEYQEPEFDEEHELQNYEEEMKEAEDEEDVCVEDDELVRYKVTDEGFQYENTSFSFLEFYRNFVVHGKKKNGAMKDEDIVSEMNTIFPHILLFVNEVLTQNHIFLAVGEDYKLEEEAAIMEARMQRRASWNRVAS